MARPIPAVLDPFLKREEGVRLEPYTDIRGRWTIGIGHLILAGERFTKITLEQAYDLLNKDVARTADFILAHVKALLNDNQFAALISFTFNEGVGSFLSSTLLTLLNEGKYTAASYEFARWDKAHVHGEIVEVQALKDRRAREAALFNTNVQEVKAA